MVIVRRQHRGAQEPREDGDLRDADGDHDRIGALAQHRSDADGEEEAGDGQQDVHEPHDRAVDPAAEAPGQDAQQHAARETERRRDDADQQRCPGAPDELAEDVSAESVQAQRESVDLARSRNGGGRDGRTAGEVIAAVGREDRRKDSHEQEEPDDDGAHDGLRVPAQPEVGVLPQAGAAPGVDGGIVRGHGTAGGGGQDGTHCTRTLGSMTE
jgi:hypothetical protein